jgi:hypothetical protein
MAKRAQIDPELRKAMDSANQLYIKGDARWFDLLAEDATVYSLNSLEPHRSRSAYRQSFSATLTAEKRAMKVLDENVQMMGESALAARSLQITQGGVIVNVRQSIVWRKTDKGWKMHHLHTALVGSPVPAKMPKTAKAVRVLNERIATVAAVLGVAQ